MIITQGLALRFGKRVLFEDVNLKFTEGNCYGLIGANGAGKSTFLKILSGEIEPSSGDIVIDKGQRLAVLKQDQYAFDEYDVLKTVIMGHKRLYDIMVEKDELYAKPDFSDEDGMKASELEGEFAELNGWEARRKSEFFWRKLCLGHRIFFFWMSLPTISIIILLLGWKTFWLLSLI